MPLHVDPKVDYAFKRVFGDQRNADILIHLLTAVLRPEVPIQSVEILNPFSEKDYVDDKLSILDIKAQDQQGHRFNVEMQLLLPEHFKGRILYYWAGMFRDQIREGDSYSNLRPAISICLVNQDLFPDVDDYHLTFELYDVEHDASYADLMQVHVLQLPKMDRQANQLRDDLEAWLYLFRYPEAIDLEHLPAIIDRPAFRHAIKELEMLTQDQQERERYEARLKAIRDQQSFIEEAAEKVEKALERGRAEGRAEGREQGEYLGRIHAYEQLLNRPLTSRDDLVKLSLDELRRRADGLQSELRNRAR